MRKKILYTFFILLFSSFICGTMLGCDTMTQYWCDHDITPATCEAPRSCKKCGASEGQALGHTWTGTCGSAQSCSRCGKQSGTSISHSWQSPTCEKPSTCSKCGATNGVALGHNYSYCDIKMPTCTENGTRQYTCRNCQSSYNEVISPTGHNIHQNICSLCGINLYTGSISTNLRASEIIVDWSGRSKYHDVLDLNQYYDVAYLKQQGYTKIEITVSMDIILKLSLFGVADVDDSQYVFLYPTENCPSGTLTEILYDTTYPYLYRDIFYHQSIFDYKAYSFTTVIDLHRLPEDKIYIRYDVGESGSWKNKNLNITVSPVC